MQRNKSPKYLIILSPTIQHLKIFANQIVDLYGFHKLMPYKLAGYIKSKN